MGKEQAKKIKALVKKIEEKATELHYAELKDQYYERFNLSGKKDDSLLIAFEKINDIRKFEIELYWKRTAYFWALIAMVFAAYFSFISIGKTIEYRRIYLTLISSMGMVLTFAWLLANKGSKFWQENWENHLDLIEDKITGPLYKTILQRPEKEDAINLKSEGVRKSDFITKPKAHSVSKINQLVGAFLFIIWLGQIIWVLSEELIRGIYLSDYWHFSFCIAIFVVSLIFLYVIYRESKTHTGKTHPVMLIRTVKVSGVIDKESTSKK